MSAGLKFLTPFVALLWLALFLPSSAFAFEDRVALVIGNEAYATDPLRNPVNDAREVAKALQQQGFKVLLKINADLSTMKGAAVEFAKIVDGANAAVFFYAGHGVQYRDRNYLVPTDAKLMAESEIPYNAFDANQILESMDDGKVRFKFMILDACRNNPFRNVFTTSSTGLAKMKTPVGTLVSYAAQPGAIALDGEGDNGLYTKYFLKELQVPGIQAVVMFQNIAAAVTQESNQKQIPEVNFTGLRGAFLFNTAPVSEASSGATRASADTEAKVELEFWSSVKDSNNAGDYQAYLQQFPNGRFGALARNRMEGINALKKVAQLANAAAALAVPDSPAASTATAALAGDGPSAQSELSKPVPVAQATNPPPAQVATVVSVLPPVNAPKPAPILVAEASPPAPLRNEVRGIEVAKPVAIPSIVAPPPIEIKPAAVAAKIPAVVSEAAIPRSPIATPSPAPPLANEKLALLSPQQGSALAPVKTPEVQLAGLIEFPDGAKYDGQYREAADRQKILHGKGKYTSKDFQYEGDFRDGKKEGRGVYVWANGDKFDGDFSDDNPNGKGHYEFSNGDRYDGEVVRGVIKGQGTLLVKEGDKFQGSFVDGKPDGRGKYSFASGDMYEGDMSAGVPSGKGKYTTRAGDKIDGTFTRGVPDGKGSYNFGNGDRYEGDIKLGDLTGVGAYYYSNGMKYEGELVRAMPKGKGAFYFNDGSWFEGNFEDGLKKAVGTAIQQDGTKRPAEIIEGAVRYTGGAVN